MNQPTILPNSCNEIRLEREQLEAFTKGDDTTFLNILWANNYSALVCYANEIVKDNLLSEDIVSETYTKLWKLRENFNNVPSIRSFLYITVKNSCFDHLRSKEIHTRIHKDILYISDYVQDMNADDYDLMYAEYIQQLYMEMNKLPERCRKVFRLTLEGYSTRQIAHKLDLAEQTVRNQNRKAKQLLRSSILKRKGSLVNNSS